MSSGAETPDPATIADDVENEGREQAVVGEYTWRDFMLEFGHGTEVEAAYRDVDSTGSSGQLFGLLNGDRKRVPRDEDWERVEFDPAEYLGFRPDDVRDRLERGSRRAKRLLSFFETSIWDTPVTKGEYTWEHFKWEYHYEPDGSVPRDADGRVVPFDPEQYLGFDPDDVEPVLASRRTAAAYVRLLEDRRTVDVDPDLDEDAFFSTIEGHTTVVNRYDLEKAVSMDRKLHFREVERYWVDKPYAFVIIFHSRKENEKKYYLIEPYLNEVERDLVEFLSGKLRTTIKYSDDDVVLQETDEARRTVLERETERLLDRYDLRAPSDDGFVDRLQTIVEAVGDPDGDRRTDVRELGERLLDLYSPGEVLPRSGSAPRPTESEDALAEDDPDGELGSLDGIEARPEPAVLAEDRGWLTEYQVEKILEVIQRDFIGYGPIDGIKHDINVEDVSCDGYGTPVFVYHTDYENLITNVRHDEDRLDNFVIKLAQRSGKGISKRQPQVDATLPDGSRAQLTLGYEVSDHGTNYTIRQFKDVPFTPIDLVNWNTFSLDQIAFLWLCIENNKSLVFAGGTASGKTTSLNAVSLFIPSNTKIVSIEDTREVELPQLNWIASVTRPSFSQDNTGDIDEFDLLEAALRQRPDYIVMGEVRGEEGRTLFQVMSTGHTTYTTFHADTVDEVLKRFTTDPINVSKTLFTALDLVSVQTQTRVRGQKVRRCKTLTEINHYDAENDEVSVQDVYQWRPETDEFLGHGTSKKLEEIAFDRGWSRDRLQEELTKRRVVLAYLIQNGLNEYAQVAATIQAYLNDPEAILTLIANGQLEDSLEDLREMESVLIDVDPAKEAMVPRPDPDGDLLEETRRILDAAEDGVLEEYRGRKPRSLVGALPHADEEAPIIATSGAGQQLLAAIEGAEDGDDVGVEDLILGAHSTNGGERGTDEPAPALAVLPSEDDAGPSTGPTGDVDPDRPADGTDDCDHQTER